MPPRNRYSDRVRVLSDTSGDTMTKQSAKAECDVNNIIRQFDRDGVLPHLRDTIPEYVVFTEDELVGSAGFDYHQALNVVRAAQDGFEALPAELRKRFHNDPGEFVAFVDDPANRDEAVELGLVRRRPPAEAVREDPAPDVQPVEEAPPAASEAE